MSAQPSDGAFDVASKWQGHRFNCAIYGDHELPDTACSCIVRELASAIDALVAEAVAAERERCSQCYSLTDKCPRCSGTGKDPR